MPHDSRLPYRQLTQRPSVRFGSVALVLLFSAVAWAGCGPVTGRLAASQAARQQPAIEVLYAGSMTKTMEDAIDPAFTKATGIAVEGEGAGSEQLAQLIRNNLRQPDVFISASPDVDERLLMGAKNKNIVTWYATFAHDALVLAYTAHSRFRTDLQAAARGRIAWYKVLEEAGFRLGRTDPQLDPKGVMALEMAALASRVYHQPELEERIYGQPGNTSQIYPEETLLARLTTGQLDAVVAYRHEAVEWGVPYVSLPSRINLGDPKLGAWYHQVVVRIGICSVTASPIVFTVTIPSTSAHSQNAERFVSFLLSARGRHLLSQSGFLTMPVLAGGDVHSMPLGLRGQVQGRLYTR